MIKIIPADRRHFTDFGWLQTYWLFSFSNYYDPANINHGSLRVFNDDIVQPHKGFATHPHEEMEIISIVLQGEMQHQDTMGNVTRIRENDVQRMTAGTGLEHSEWNNGDEPVHFFQIWLTPDTRGLAPSYDQKNFDPQSWQNTLALLAGNETTADKVRLNTDAQIYRAGLDADKTINYLARDERNQFVYVITGRIMINGEKVDTRDQARISGEKSLRIQAHEDTDLLLIDVPAKIA